MSNDLHLASLLCSRLCHDLISPVSAMNNGLEVLEDGDDQEMQETALALIGMSGKKASAKLQFARLAYGASTTSGEVIDLSEVRAILEDLYEGGKVTLAWDTKEAGLDKVWVKVMLNLISLAADCIPRGGVLTISIHVVDGTPTVRLVAKGDRARLNEDVLSALKGGLPLERLDARSIQPHAAGLTARASNLQLDAEASEECVAFFLKNA